MSQLSLSLDTPLMVRDGRGRYRPADADQILEAARQVIEQKMQRGETFTSPEAVKDYLRAKLAGYEQEVFAMLFLDTRHRLIDYVEMFHGTIDSAEVHPREVVNRRCGSMRRRSSFRTTIRVGTPSRARPTRR